MTINTLTTEQRNALETYRDRGIQYGLATETYEDGPASLRPLVDAAYAAGGLPPPSSIEIVEGPLALQQRANELLGTQGVWYPACYGQHDADFLEYYAFFNNEVGVDCASILPLRELSMRVGWFIPFDTVCVISRRPTHVSLLKEVLHCSTGPAIEYGDGTKVFALYGVVFAEEDALRLYVKREASTKEVLSLRNVEQRAALIQHLGMDRFISSLSPKVLDEEGEDQLLEVVLNGQRRVYYFMQNPSVDERHLEAVPPDVSTIKQAIMWRNYGDASLPFKAPDALT